MTPNVMSNPRAGPPHSPARAKPLQPFPDYLRSGLLACVRLQLANFYADTEQVPLNLNALDTTALRFHAHDVVTSVAKDHVAGDAASHVAA